MSKLSSQLPFTALITGASRRFGLHMTQSLLQQGWRVLALTREKVVVEKDQKQETSLTQLLQEYPSQLRVLTCELLKQASLEQACESILQDEPHLDFVLHNASIYQLDRSLEQDTNMHQFDLFYGIHMKVPAYLNEALQPLLERSIRKTACILHITDIYADNPNPSYTHYCATKAGAQNLVLSYAKRFAPRIRVNAIQPGPVKFLPTHSQVDQSNVLSETLLAVEGGFEPLEQMVHAILDNEYMTAAVVPVDGGRSVTRG